MAEKAAVYTKTVQLVGGHVEARISRNGVEFKSDWFYGFFMIPNAASAAKYFKKAHAWADAMIETCKRCECEGAEV